MNKVSWLLQDNLQDFTCCSESRCKCTQFAGGKYKADCSSLDLHEFPEFSDDVKEITFFNNSFDSLTGSSVLPNGLIRLDISACQLNEIHKGFLQNYSHLEYLDISHNTKLTLEVLPNVTYDLQFKNIKTLKFNAIQCKYGKGLVLKQRYIIYLKNTSLEEVHLSSNRLEEIEQFVLCNIPDTIQRVIAADNRLIFSWAVLEIPYLKNLEYIDFSGQYSSSSSFLSLVEKNCNDSKPHVNESRYIPHSCPSKTKTTKLESCLHEFITTPPKRTVNIYMCMPKSIQTILIPHSVIGQTSTPYIYNSLFDFRHVKHTELRGNVFINLLSGAIFGNASSFIDYADNYISDINYTWFHRANLTHLDLSGNFLDAFFRTENSGKLLEKQVFIRNISLGRNRINRIPDDIFKDTINVREIDLSQNELENLHFIGPNMKRLTFLNLSRNYIHTLSIHEMEVLDSIISDNLTIDLSDNDILCTCDTLNFLKWTQNHALGSKIIFENIKKYKCTSENSTKFSLSHLPMIIGTLEKQCATYTVLIVGSSIIMSAIFFTMIGGLIYRYRWKIRYMYYMAKRGYKGSAHARNIDQRSLFQYDAFISYADEDRVIILKNVISQLEENSDLKLCIHERDFIPGCDIAENIANAIRDSRRTVCFVSNNYLSSHWCMYEFNMALMERIHARGEDSMLILVLLNNMDSKRAPMSMMEFIQSSTYIEFPEDPTYQSLFWSKLSEAID